MTVPCNYEINVAKETTAYTGKKYMRHYCRIEIGDCLPETAEEKFREIRALFPEDYELTLYAVTCYRQVACE